MAKLALQLVCTNDAAGLPALFASLRAQTFRDWHLYVVDDGSRPDEKVQIREAVERSGIPYTFFRTHPTTGFAGSQNFLFSRHESEYVLPIVGGVSLPADALAKLMAPVFAASGCAVSSASGLSVYRRSAVLDVGANGSLFDGAFVSVRADEELVGRLREGGYAEHGVFRPIFFRGSDEIRYLSFRNRVWMLLSTDSRVRAFFCFFPWIVRKPAFILGALLDTWQLRGHLRARRDWMRMLRARQTVLPTKIAPVPEYDIAVVTVSHNDLYPENLASLERARKATSLRIGVVVVDNASTAFRANEVVCAHIPDAHVLLREKNYGFGHSSNRGAREVHARYYFFLNPDTLLEDERIFEKLWAFMQTHDDAGIVAPRIFYFDGRLQDTCRRFPKWYVPFVQRTSLKHTAFGKRYADEFSMVDFDHAVTREVDWVQGSALCIDAQILRRIGGFDERYFMYFEDIDLCRQVKGLGKKVYYYPEATLKHAHGKESAKISGFVRNFAQNPIARAHIWSWLKYLLKWSVR